MSQICLAAFDSPFVCWHSVVRRFYLRQSRAAFEFRKGIRLSEKCCKAYFIIGLILCGMMIASDGTRKLNVHFQNWTVSNGHK